jgi:hypothetical protein
MTKKPSHGVIKKARMPGLQEAKSDYRLFEYSSFKYSTIPEGMTG